MRNIIKGYKHIVNLASYTMNMPEGKWKIKVAIQPSNPIWLRNNPNWFTNNVSMKLEVFEDALYEDGFVSLDGGKNYFLGTNFLFHKLKRTKQ